MACSPDNKTQDSWKWKWKKFGHSFFFSYQHTQTKFYMWQTSSSIDCVFDFVYCCLKNDMNIIMRIVERTTKQKRKEKLKREWTNSYQKLQVGYRHTEEKEEILKLISKSEIKM